jgi:hypothetical protein
VLAITSLRTSLSLNPLKAHLILRRLFLTIFETPIPVVEVLSERKIFLEI